MGETTSVKTADNSMLWMDAPAVPAGLDAAIANGQSLSAALALGKTYLVGLIMPAAWTAANLTFQGSIDGTNFFNLYDEFGSEINIPVAVDRFVRLNPTDWSIFSHIKVRSGTAATPVNQGAPRTIKLVTRVF